ncbi:hypothetical protein A33M_1897 [Rhodovulum sp. PH10]|nr:hypothetical protein A33M_1897 [Rhodovulum sp. PH10]
MLAGLAELMAAPCASPRRSRPGAGVDRTVEPSASELVLVVFAVRRVDQAAVL